MAITQNLPQRDRREGMNPLVRIPLWYKEGAPYRYNWRTGLGFLPGIILIGVISGKTFVASALVVLMINLLMHSLGYELIQLGLVVASVFVCQAVNLYCMIPLMWHSVLNIPLFMIFHAFLVIVGLWAVIQIEEFRKQDPRVTFLAERGLFVAIPAINLVMVSWLSVMIGGRHYLPITLAITGLFLVSLFIVPLQSSFVKPGTPQAEGLILPRTIGLSYLLLIALLPGIVYSGINSIHFLSNLKDLLTCQLYFTGPVFVLSLLEAQGIFQWFGDISERSIIITRWCFGIITMASLSFYLTYLPAATDMPRLAVPLIFSFIALLSSLSTQGYGPKFIGGLLGLNVLLVLAIALQLSWDIDYNFSLMSLPLWALQLILVVLVLASLLLLLGWRKDLTLLWPTYHAVFVGCEFILNNEGIYSLSFLLITGFAAVLLCLRLHTVGRLPLPLTILCVCLHVLKLSHFLPDSTSFSTASSFLSLFGLMMTAVSLLRLLSSESLTLKQLLSLSFVLAIGLVCSVQLLVIPLLTSVTHSPPTSSDLAAFINLFVGMVLQYFLPRLKDGSSSSSLIIVKYLPPSLFFLAMLLWLIQPEFNLIEISDAVGVVFLHGIDVNRQLNRIITSEQLSILAWIVVMKWLVVLYSLMIVVSLSVKLCLPELMLQTALSLFSGSASLLFSLQFGHHTPLSFLGVLYGLSGLIGGFLLSLVLLKKPNTPNWFEGLLLFVLSCFCVVTIAGEWGSLPSHVTEPVSIPSASLFLLLFVSIAAVLKAKSISGRPFLPLICNASILIGFLIAVCLQLPGHLERAIVVSLASCLFLLLQTDGWFVSTKRTSSLFLAPSLVASSLTLFVISFLRIVDDLSKEMTILTSLELICLFACIPGQIKFLYSLWKGLPLRLSVMKVLCYILPNAFLVQYGGPVNVVLGSTVVLAFSLLAVAEFQTFLVL